MKKQIKRAQMKQNIIPSNIKIKQGIKALFPRQPYKTQQYIANELYHILQGSKYNKINANKEETHLDLIQNYRNIKAVIVQSPTGTGKTYALLAGVLAWLRDNPYQLATSLQKKNIQNNKQKKKQSNQQSQQQTSQSAMPSWLISKNIENKLQKLKTKKQQKANKLKSIKQVKQLKQNKNQKNKPEKTPPTILQWQIQDLQDIAPNPNPKRYIASNPVTKQSQFMLQGQNEDQDQLPKIIFVSRTHSQLSQVMDSIGDIVSKTEQGGQGRGKGNQKPLGEIGYLSLASKEHLCVHGGIQGRVDQKCKYLLAHGGCPYYHQYPIKQFMGLKIQQSKKLGQSSQLCSYFSLRNLIPHSSLLCLPYPTLLNPQIRSRMNINLHNSIIIFDQAHNIIEQELSIRSPEISYGELLVLARRIDQYLGKYGGKMGVEGRGIVEHMGHVCRSLMGVIKAEYQGMEEEMKIRQQQQKYHQYIAIQPNTLGKESQRPAPTYKKLTKLQLFTRMKLPQIKLHKIKNYISLSNFDQKLVHFTAEGENQANGYGTGNAKGEKAKLKKSQREGTLAVERFGELTVGIINCFVDFIAVLVTGNSKYQLHSHSSPKEKCLPQILTQPSSLDCTIALIKNLIPNPPPNKNPKSPNPLHQASIKLFTMQPTQLPSIIQQARLSIFAGGTMEPVCSFLGMFQTAGLRGCGQQQVELDGKAIDDQGKGKFRVVKAGHVIGDGQCNVYCVGGVQFNKQGVKDQLQRHKILFTYNTIKQYPKQLLQNTTKLIKKILQKAPTQPSGTVIFLQTYALLQQFSNYLCSQISNIQVFYDSQAVVQNLKTQVTVFDRYQNVIKKEGKSAVLVSVMGGRLSEGINFSDQLARNIIVLGLPYASVYAPEIVQKMTYLDAKHKLMQKLEKLPTFESANKTKKQKQNHFSYENQRKLQRQTETGNSYYQNLCTKTINQTIGRGIRHKDDYADIYLIDWRFVNDRSGVCKRLPDWMSKRVTFIDFYAC